MASFRRKRYSFKEWLISLSGEDAQIIFNEKTKDHVKITFALIGCFVLIIFIFSFYSSAHFIYQLFNEKLLLAIPVGIVWGLMIANIYLLLLYTITPKILKGKERTIKGIKIKDIQENKLLENISVGFRIAFVVLIAIIIAQPWLITTFSSAAQKDLDNYKQQYKNTFLIQADSILIVHEVKLRDELFQNLNFVTIGKSDSLLIANAGKNIFEKIEEDEKFLKLAIGLKEEINKSKKKWIIGNKDKTDSLYNKLTDLVDKENANDSLFILNYKPISAQNAVIENLLNATYQKLLTTISEKIKQYKKLDAVLTASNFFIRRIQLINSTFPLAWGMTSVVVFAFIIPIILKYRIRNTSNFYEVKKELEEKIVKDEYQKFKVAYSTIFKTKVNIDNVSFYESCIDPPFNTTKKEQNQQFQNQEAFLSEIYKDGEEAELNKYLVGETVSEK